MPGPLFHKFVTAMRQGAQKQARKFCGQKAVKKRKAHPIQPEKGEPGCVLGAGEGCGRCREVGKPKIRTKMHHISIQHMQKENRRKPSVFAGFVAGAEGLGLRSAPVSSRQSATGARSPLGTRFWSGCGRTQRGAKEGRCCPILPTSHKMSGAGLVL